MNIPTVNETPEAFLDHPAVVKAAPWCRKLDLFELALVLVLQPAGIGRAWNRGELLAHVSAVSGSTPLGRTYFQRVNRAIAKLVKCKIVRPSGRGKTQVFDLPSTGFAALLLNVRHLEADPTDDPSEFELKLMIVTAWALMGDKLRDTEVEDPGPGGLRTFLEGVDGVKIAARTVLTPELIEDTFDVQRFVGRQRARVEVLLAQTEAVEKELAKSSSIFAHIDLRDLLLPEAAKDAGMRKVVETASQVVSTSLPVLTARARALRYRRYLEYLNDLSALYAETMKGVDLSIYRQVRRSAG